MSTGPYETERAEIARRYLAEVSATGVEQLPPTVLMREVAELRRLLASVLAVIDGQAVTLTYEEGATVLGALGEAAIYRAGDAPATTYRELASGIHGQLRRAAGGAR
jgi:hypothetical protein